MDYDAEAKRHREMAEEYRTMAECARDDGLRVHYRKLSEVYDGLAKNEDQVARNSKH
jgi:hypothetical protein